MGNPWSVFCRASSGASFMFSTHSSSCINNVAITCFDFALLIMFLFTVFSKTSLRWSSTMAASNRSISSLQLFSSICNGVLGLAYLCYGVWDFQEKWGKTGTTMPLYSWSLLVVQGILWLLLGLTLSLRKERYSSALFRFLSIFVLLFAGIACGLSIFSALFKKEISVKIVLDVLSFLGSSLLLLCIYKGYRCENNVDGTCDPLLSTDANGSNQTGSVVLNVTPFEKASVLSKFTFWWLNPLMKKGREKTLDDKDLPKLREKDRAESCYLEYMEIFNIRKQMNPSSPPSILKTIFLCHWKEILVSGFFAAVKVVTISAGPVLLKSFIKVAEGNERFEYERYLLVTALFFIKVLESISQRQWYFRTKLIGLKVRSLLIAAIYQKQLRLSNAAKLRHSTGEIMSYVTVDAYRIGEFPYWLHQIWTTIFQLCLAVIILSQAVGLATIASVVVIILTVLGNTPIAKSQHKFQSSLMVAQDERLKAMTEALVNMKVLKLYAWDTLFRHVIESLRKIEDKWLKGVLLHIAYNSFLFWTSPVLVSTVTFGACYILGVPLNSSNVFTFIATMRLVQNPVATIPDVIGVLIQANVAFSRVTNFLEAPELETSNSRLKSRVGEMNLSISFKSADLSWDGSPSKPTLRNINLEVKTGDKIAICGEVGSGKPTLLAAVLGEVPVTRGTVQVHGTIAYVSQSAWIQSGSIRENILFGSTMDKERYQDTIKRCSLVKDLALLPHGDLTEIGARGVNLSGGQKQRIQLARALYKNSDIYVLDDPFSAVDAHTATSLFNDYVREALSAKTILLVTHQVGFLPAFDSVLLLSDGKILHAASYSQLLASSQGFRDLVDAHKESAGSEKVSKVTCKLQGGSSREISGFIEKRSETSVGEQLIKKEEREVGDTGLKPYILYLQQNKGFFTFSVTALCHVAFVIGQILQNCWVAANVDDPNVTTLRLIVVYLTIGVVFSLFLLARSLLNVTLGLQASRGLFSHLLISLFRAPMSFYDSTPLGRILTRVSSDLSIIDLDIPFNLMFTFVNTTNCFSSLVVLVVVTWQVLFASIPMVFLAIRLQRYYFFSAKELMRINGTTKSFIANHLAESIAGALTIRAFKEEERFFAKNLELIDTNGSPFFHYFASNEWLIQRVETLSAIILSVAGLCMVLLPTGSFSSGFIGLALSYGVSLNAMFVLSISSQCMLANNIISVERLDQYMHITSEAPEVIKENRPPINWPTNGKVEIKDLKIRYRQDAPLVLRGISCTFEGGHKIGIVGRTGSGKTTIIGALFRLVEPAGGKILVDGIDISTIGLHDLRSRFGIIPQDPTLFTGTVRYNLDPLGQHNDQEIWEVLGKCQLQEAVHEKTNGLDSAVMEDGSNWSMGQRQLFCLGRALLRRSKILVLDEATASIDNATDSILQKTIRAECCDCTVITVAHRIPTVMDCTRVLAISDGELAEYDEPMKLMAKEDSLFAQLVKEYWSHSQSPLITM